METATQNMNLTAYLLYLAITIPLIVWVGRMLFKNGRVFIKDIFKNNQELTDSINKLLLVGFYLVNMGYTVFALQILGDIETAHELVEVLSKKIGLIVLVLGGMHFMNMTVLYKLRKRAVQWKGYEERV